MIHYVVQLWCTGCRLDRAAPATHPQMHWALLCFGQIWDILKGFQRDQSSNWFYHSWSNLGNQTLFVNCNDSNHHHVMSCIVLKLINHHPQKGFDHHKQVGDESETLWKEISVGTTVGAMHTWYLSFFLHAHILSPENFTLGKSINLRQICPRDKTA